jgi:hypothetical protein
MRRIWAATLLLLVSATYRLWIPSSHWASDSVLSTAKFPRLAMTSLPEMLMMGIDFAAFVALIASCIFIILRRDCVKSWWAMVVIAVALSALFICNQHRLQPWAYQGWLYAIVFAAASPKNARRLIVALTISIYAYSAMGKFDQQFLKTVGPSMVGVLIAPVGDGVKPNEHLRLWIERSVVLLPVAELLIAASLICVKTRRYGGIAAIAMHTCLLGILGPFGLGHSWGVLVWNVFLAVQSWLLFVHNSAHGDSEMKADASVGNSRLPEVQFFAFAVIGVAVVMPVFERRPSGEVYGYWDHWLSWSLYSPHTSRVDLEVHESALASLPAVVSNHIRPGGDSDGWVSVQIDRWSLAELSVPVYPQARFQLGVANEIAKQLVAAAHKPGQANKRGAIRIKIRSVANRSTGSREEVWAVSSEGIEKQRQRFWLLP